jgi:pyruvate-formate lyase-activating enzyme
LPDLSDRLAKTLPYFLHHWKVEGEGVRACCIVGTQGDPLLYGNLPSLLRDLHFSGIEVGVVSNGYAATDHLIHFLAMYCKFVGFSVDAGTESSYKRIKNCPDDAWNKLISTVNSLARVITSHGLRNDIGWKILVLPDSQHEIFQSCQLAKELGCRYVQIRPAELAPKEWEKIQPSMVEDQVQKAIEELEEPGRFEIVGIRHKFTTDYQKILPSYCHLTPLTVTVTSDGKAYACVDRRCDDSTLLANCKHQGWRALRDFWGSGDHVYIINRMINRGGKGPDCNIRCSNYGYNKFFENFFVQDNVDWKLI